jgi:ABC-type Fe3+-citrate transport system substrate-binding protein
VFATIALLLADAEEGDEKFEKLNKRVSDMEDKLKKRGL